MLIIEDGGIIFRSWSVVRGWPFRENGEKRDERSHCGRREDGGRENAPNEPTSIQESVTNEPERKGGGAGVGATERVSDSLNEMGEGFLSAIDAGISAFRRDRATPGEIAEAIDLRGPPVAG